MIEGAFEFKEVENSVSKFWSDNDVFKYELDSSKPGYTIILPPPNVTGSLHLGHALCYTLQDILIRYKRLRGYNALWQAGLDHAGIVTQLLVEKDLAANGIDPQALSREELLEKIWEWKDKSGSTILGQMHRLGCSIDLSRLRFTMDEKSSTAVIKTFVELYQGGMIYKDTRLVNWDPKLQSAISDLEVVEKEQHGRMYYIKYKLVDSDDFIMVGTTRPETLFGDSAVAVNPEDERYTALIGSEVIVPICGRRIRIIADAYSDPEKGTGAVKITPAHDFNDFDVGRRHNLEEINILDKTAKLNDRVPEKFVGMDRYEARESVVAELSDLGLLDHIEDVVHTVPYADRSGVVIEPYLTEQWFIDAQKMAQEAIRVVEGGDVRFVPKNWTNTYFEWMRNIRPWCISRQIIWGHQIPAWYGPDGDVFVAHSEGEAALQAEKKYGKVVELRRDEDVLDTWYSSALWPFTSIGWPGDEAAMSQHYPNSTLMTGFDIIFFWVARMMMMGLYFNKKPPFNDVYIHALVRDAQGNKMSKSRGNVIDPIDLIDEFGSDALRFSMAAFATPGRDICISKDRIKGYKGLLTKLWNAVKFADMNGCFAKEAVNFSGDPSLALNRWIIGRFQILLKDVDKAIDEYRFDEYAARVYQFLWRDFCDWYLELSKPVYRSGNASEILETQSITHKIIHDFLRVLSPISPFICEYISRECFKETGAVTLSEIPEHDPLRIDYTAMSEISFIQNLVSEIRSIRKELNIPFSIKCSFSASKPISELGLAAISAMAKVDYAKEADGNIRFVVDDAEVKMQVQGVDLDAQKRRLKSELDKIEKSISDTQGVLKNEKFLAKASTTIVSEMREKLFLHEERKAKILSILQY